MKQKLLTDIELDVHGLKYLMDLYSKEPTQTLFELIKQNILHIQGCLDKVKLELDIVPDSSLATPAITEINPPAAEENNNSVIEEPIVEEPVTEEIKIEESLTETTIPVKNGEPIIVATEEIILVENEKTIPIATEETTPVELEITEPPSIDNIPVVEEEYKPSVLGESIKMSAGLRHSISLNDSFRFSRELFGGDVELMNRVVEQMSVMSSYKTATAFLTSKINVTEDNEALNDLLELLKKFFNQPA